MRGGDFYSSEQSVTLDKATNARIVFENKKGEQTVLKSDLPLLEGEELDGMFMSKKALVKFFEDAIEDCEKTGVMFSLHRSEEHTSELQSRPHLVCRLLLE